MVDLGTQFALIWSEDNREKLTVIGMARGATKYCSSFYLLTVVPGNIFSSEVIEPLSAVDGGDIELSPKTVASSFCGGGGYVYIQIMQEDTRSRSRVDGCMNTLV